MKFNIKYLIAFFSGGILLWAISSCILPMISSFAFIRDKKPFEFDPVAMLSINVGILQAIIGIIALSMGLAGFFTFKSIKDEVDKLKQTVDKHDKYINDNTDKNIEQAEIEGSETPIKIEGGKELIKTDNTRINDNDI